MADSIEAQKRPIKQFLTEYKAKFIVPVYQRRYTWGADEEVQTLFDDISDFIKERDASKTDRYHFLGCAVLTGDRDDELEIIDGQQRITTLFLMLRAIYERIKNEKVDEAAHFKKEIEQSIWICDEMTGKPFFDQIRLESRVISDDDNNILRDIIISGKADENAVDQYSVNYRKIQDLLDEYATNNSINGLYPFIMVLLNKVIMLPIISTNKEMALNIFATLNNRGKPLEDADIFKAAIYEHLSSDEEKKKFIDDWKKLEKDIQDVDGESIQKLFTYYMFYIRAIDGDTSTSVKGVRKYFGERDNKDILNPNLMSHLSRMANIFRVAYRCDEIEGEEWSHNLSIKKSLDILRYYPNEFWKYPVIVYYLEHGKEDNFAELFNSFLRKLTIQLMTRFVHTPNLNFIKSDVMRLDTEIPKSVDPSFNFKSYDENIFRDHLKNIKSNISRMVLALIAYNNPKQIELLPYKWEIEHIFPKKYDTTYFNNSMTKEEIDRRIEFIGNKIPFEKSLNIKASNDFFSVKKKHYSQSGIADALSLSEKTGNWSLEDIDDRNADIYSLVKTIINKWGGDNQERHINAMSGDSDGLSSEDEIAVFYLKYGEFDEPQKMYVLGDSFVVRKGTKISRTEKQSLLDTESLASINKKLIDDGVISREKGEFLMDYSFSSPSQPAGIIKGRPVNGREAWKNKDGVSFGDCFPL